MCKKMRRKNSFDMDVTEMWNRKKELKRNKRKNTMFSGKSRLKSYRVSFGFTQEQIAYKAKISLRSYQAYEQELRVPNIAAALRIARALSSSCEWLWSTGEKDSRDKIDFPVRSARFLVELDGHGYTRLKFRRKELGFTQKHLAFEAGVGYRSYQAYEQEVQAPNVLVAVKIAKLLNYNCFYLWGENVDSF